MFINIAVSPGALHGDALPAGPGRWTATSAVVDEVDAEFAKHFGRSYGGSIDTYRMEDAEIALITLGTATCTARVAVDELRAEGKKVGLIKLRFMRPFPHEELRKALPRT